MTFEEAGLKYAQLRQQFDQGKITPQEFERKVSELVVAGPDGVTWQLEPNTGTWIQTGAPQSTISAKKKKEQKPPETLMQFFWLIIRGAVTNLPKIIIVGLFMAVLTWVMHTYIIAKINDGLMYKSNLQVVNAVVHLQKTYFPGVDAFWALLAYFLSNFFGRMFSVGFINWVKSILLLPILISQSFIKARMRSIILIIFGASLSLLVSYFIKNFMVSWIFAFGILLTMTAHFQSMETLVLRLALSDFQRLFRIRLVSEGLEYDSIYLTLLGLSAGFALAGFWRTKLTYTLTSFIVLILLSIAFLFLMKRREAQKLALFLLTIAGGVFVIYLPVFAWCEGGSLSRSGGSWTKWWGSNNADVVRQLGVKPSVFSFVGGILGTISGVVSSTVTTIGTFISGVTTTVPKPIIPPKIKPDQTKIIKEKVKPETVQKPSPVDTKRIEELRIRQEQLEREQRKANRSVTFWNWVTWGTEKIQSTADLSIDVLATVTGPVGGRVKDAYTMGKHLGKGLGEGMVDGNYKQHLTDGLYEGGKEILVDKIFDKAPGVFKKGQDYIASSKAYKKGMEMANPYIKQGKELVENHAKNIADSRVGKSVRDMAKNTGDYIKNTKAYQKGQKAGEWAKDKIGDYTSLGGKVPGGGKMEYGGNIDWGKVDGGKVGNALTGKGKMDDKLRSHIRDKFVETGKDYVKDKIKDSATKDPLKDKLKEGIDGYFGKSKEKGGS